MLCPSTALCCAPFIAATSRSKSRSNAVSEITILGDKVDPDTSIGFLPRFSTGFFETLALPPFIKKPIAELVRTTSTPPTDPYRAISHRLVLAPAATLSARNCAISASEVLFSAILACWTAIAGPSAGIAGCRRSRLFFRIELTEL
jgi:hypothetical protein